MCRWNSPLFQACYTSIGRKIQYFYTFIALVNQQGIQIKPHFLCTLSTLYRFIGCFNDISDLLYGFYILKCSFLDGNNKFYGFFFSDYVINS